MLTLFENITEQLTDLEKQTLVPKLIELLRQTHEDKRISANKILEFFSAQGFPTSKIRLCKMIAFVRVKNLINPYVVIGAKNGYFLTIDPAVIENQIESLQGRCDAMAAVIDSLKAQKLSNKKSIWK
jgi:hypothetical protein